MLAVKEIFTGEKRILKLSLVISMTGWAFLLPVLKTFIPLPRLVQLMLRRPRKKGRIAPGEIINAAKLINHAFQGNCLERSLLLYRYLTWCGGEPDLIVGMRKLKDNNWTGHAWILLGDRTLDESLENLQEFKPLFKFDAAGLLQEL